MGRISAPDENGNDRMIATECDLATSPRCEGSRPVGPDAGGWMKYGWVDGIGRSTGTNYACGPCWEAYEGNE